MSPVRSQSVYEDILSEQDYRGKHPWPGITKIDGDKYRLSNDNGVGLCSSHKAWACLEL